MERRIGQAIITEKQEWKRGEFEGLTVRELPKFDAKAVYLVHCPARNYQPASITDCQECPFWHGFAPIKGGKRMTSLCGHPIGRGITKVEI